MSSAVEWNDEPVETEAGERSCPQCGTKHKITLQVAPPGYGGLEPYELHCEKCGALISAGKAFGASIKRVRKKK